MIFCGIDLGLEGGIAMLDQAADPVMLISMPIVVDTRGKKTIDVVSLRNILHQQERPQLVVMEWVHSFGNEARRSIFSFGRGTGKVQALLELDGFCYEETEPQEWKKEVLEGTDKSKEAAIGYCLNRWPSLKERLKKPSKKNSYYDGLADALCLAEFARRRILS